MPPARSPSGSAFAGAGTTFVLLATLGFAAASTLTTLAIAQQLSLYNVLTWRYVLGSVVMVTYVGSRSHRRMPWPVAARFMLVGGGGQALFVGMALSSLQYVSVATLAFLFFTYPSWMTLVQAVRGVEPITARRVGGLLLSFGGIVVMVAGPTFAANGGSSTFALDGPALHGAALALGAAVIYGLYIPLMGWMQQSHAVSVTRAYGTIGAAICFLMLAASNRSFTTAMSPTAWGAILALTLFSTVLPSLFFLMGLIRLGPVRTASLSTVEPLLTALLGAVVLHQPLTAPVIGGGALIVAASVVLQFRRERVA